MRRGKRRSTCKQEADASQSGKIQSGDFTREWIEEYKSGAKNFYAMRAKIDGHQIEEVGKNLRSMMPWIAKNKLVDKEKN